MPIPPALPLDRRIYNRAPVMEAAIDIRCGNRPTFTIADVAELAEQISGEFRTEGETIERIEEVRADGARRITERPLGLALRRYPDETAVLQMQVEGFTYSRLRPYERWELFREDARRLWENYMRVAAPHSIKRVGVRFINRIEVNDVIDELQPFLRIYPVTPWQLKAPPASFTLQVRVPRPDHTNLVVNIAPIPSVNAANMAILLDLDASMTSNIASDSDAVWNVVEHLHVVVEEAFEDAITEHVRELIK